jgi:hypothetical protein
MWRHLRNRLRSPNGFTELPYQMVVNTVCWRILFLLPLTVFETSWTAPVKLENSFSFPPCLFITNVKTFLDCVLRFGAIESIDAKPTVNFRCGESTLTLTGRTHVIRTTGTILCFDKYAILARVGSVPYQLVSSSLKRLLKANPCRQIVSCTLAATLSLHFTLHIRRHLLGKLSRFRHEN